MNDTIILIVCRAFQSTLYLLISKEYKSVTRKYALNLEKEEGKEEENGEKEKEEEAAAASEDKEWKLYFAILVKWIAKK